MTYLSVCSGIEAATVAAQPLGWQPWAYAEIDPFCCALLRHYYPETMNLGDLTRYADWPDATLDLLVGGTPCQSFSVAGLRAGLDDPRGGLLFAYLAVARRYRPRWVVWENVPGVLSIDGGRAFGALLGGLAELGYGFAYRVLDAQYFRLAQRRKRVFVVGYLGDWRRAAAVLFERASLSGHSAPRREATEDAASPIARGSDSSSGYRLDADTADNLVSGTLSAHHGNIRDAHAWTNQLIAYGGNNTAGSIDIASAVLAKGGTGRCDFATETFIAHSLTGEGFDASEDGSGRGLPLVFDTTQITSRENRSQPQPGDPCHPLAAGAHPPAVAFSQRERGDDGRGYGRPPMVFGDVVGAIDTVKPHCVAFSDVADPVAANQARTYTREGTGNFRVSNVAFGRSGVRRLTPRECERLQGFPDDYTRIPVGKRGQPPKDGPRYKALGNSMAVPCMSWIFRRIQAVDDIRAGR